MRVHVSVMSCCGRFASLFDPKRFVLIFWGQKHSSVAELSKLPNFTLSVVL